MRVGEDPKQGAASYKCQGDAAAMYRSASREKLPTRRPRAARPSVAYVVSSSYCTPSSTIYIHVALVLAWRRQKPVQSVAGSPLDDDNDKIPLPLSLVTSSQFCLLGGCLYPFRVIAHYTTQKGRTFGICTHVSDKCKRPSRPFNSLYGCLFFSQCPARKGQDSFDTRQINVVLLTVTCICGGRARGVVKS